VLAASAAKGLELDGVVIADPEGILAGGQVGARLLYIAMTRAVQSLVLVHEQDRHAVLE
jgi:DNA helicase IV